MNSSLLRFVVTMKPKRLVLPLQQQNQQQQKNFNDKPYNDDDLMSKKDSKKLMKRNIEANIISEVRELCNNSRIACSKVLALMSELEKLAAKPPIISRQQYGVPRQHSAYAKQVARYSTSAEDKEAEFIKSERDYCKDFDITSKIGGKKRCSIYVKKPPPPPPPPCAVKNPDVPNSPDCCGEEEFCEYELEDVSDLPDMFKMHEGIIDEISPELKNYHGEKYRNSTFYSNHKTTFYDFMVALSNMRTDQFCTPAERSKRSGDTREAKCLFICAKQDPKIIRTCDLSSMTIDPSKAQQKDQKK